MIKEQDFLFKIVIVGNQGVGKSSLFVRYCDDHFAQSYLPTIGVDFKFKTTSVDGKMCKLQIWDTAGQQRFRTITSAYYRSSQVVLIIYDTTDPSTFREIQDYWLQQTKTNSDQDVMICIVGNKCDMPSQLHDAEVDQLAKTVGISNYNVSAKTGQGVEAMFNQICEQLIKSTSTKRKQKIQLKMRQRERSKIKCCK